jgi:hypothetical protein
MAAAAAWQRKAESSWMSGTAHAVCINNAQHGSTALDAAGIAWPWLAVVVHAAATGGQSSQAVAAASLYAAMLR